MTRTRWVLLLVWLVVTGAWGAHYVQTQVAAAKLGPDAYAATWRFQVLAFSLFPLPVLVAALVVLMGLSSSGRTHRRPGEPQ